MVTQITKVFTFEAAHQLPNHAGKCARPHGHGYRLEVTVGGEVVTKKGAPNEGMVVDFDRIRAVWKAKLEPLLDHRDLNESLQPDCWPTTAENIAAWCARRFSAGGLDVRQVRLWETPTGCATVTLDEWGWG